MKKIALLLLFLPFSVYGLSLEKAVDLSLKNHPLIKQERAFLKSQKYDYFSTYGNFFPSIDFQYTYSKYIDVEPYDYFSRNYGWTFNWTVYSSGQNIMQNRIKKLLFKAERENFRETKLDVIYQVKNAYYTAAANREIVKIKKVQLKSAEKNYQMAQKKLKLGLVTKADYLQAKVRYENLRYQLEDAENRYRKSIAELNSLIGYPLDWDTQPEENILKKFEKDGIPPFSKIEKLAFNRPVFRRYEFQLRSAKLQTKQSVLAYTPTLFFSYSFNNSYSSMYGEKDRYRVATVGLSWNIFSGLQKYYNYLSSKENERYYRYRLEELKRQIRLSLYGYYLDLKSAYKNLQVAKTLLKEAEENYKQALGEYKAGKGDIISLLTAESSLAGAKETYIQSLLNIALTRAMLEREMGVENLLQEGVNR
ncbi:TolC family protein [Persephonella sp.]